MRPQSAKAKGRRAQQLVRDSLRIVGTAFDLEDGDFESTSMGAPGVDVRLSPAAQRVFGNWAIEVKNVEKLDVRKVFSEHATKYHGKLPLLVHTKNRADVLVTMNFELWLALLRELGRTKLEAEQGTGSSGPQHKERDALIHVRGVKNDPYFTVPVSFLVGADSATHALGASEAPRTLKPLDCNRERGR